MINDTQLTEFVGWQSGPYYRGTWQIVCLCIMTLGLCLHTSLHLNIETPQPWQERHWLSRKALDVWREAQWVLVGLFAPELVLYIAYRQAEVVRKLTPTVENLWRQTWNGEHYPRATYWTVKDYDCRDRYGQRLEWTEIHNWYLLMGGFVFETDDGGDEYIPGSPRLVLNASGLIFLLGAGMDFLPRITKAEIEGMSSANMFTKMLTLFQAAYFLFQWSFRWIFGDGFSLLETFTCAHVIVTALIYWCWMDKPQSVRYQMVIRGPWAKGAAALLYMKNACSHLEDGTTSSEIAHFLPDLLGPCRRQQDHSYSCWRNRSVESARIWEAYQQLLAEIGSGRRDRPGTMSVPRVRPYIRGTALRSEHAWKLSRFKWYSNIPKQVKLKLYVQALPPLTSRATCHRSCDSGDIKKLLERIEHAIAFVGEHYDLWREQMPMDYPWTWHEFFRSFRQEVSWQSADKPSGMIAEDARWTKLSRLLLNLSVSVYGGVHLAGFRYDFASITEQALWILASGIILLSGLYGVHHFSQPRSASRSGLATSDEQYRDARYFLNHDTKEDNHNSQWRGPLPRSWRQIWRWRELKVVLPLSLVITARFFVLLESLISLRSMRGDVYKYTGFFDDVLPKFQ